MQLAQTLHMGPYLQTAAPGFTLRNHENKETHLRQLFGEQGLLLGFTGDIWEPASVRRIIWMQRHYMQFCKKGVGSALLTYDKPVTLSGFSMSSQVPLEFPLLADADHAVHEQYNMTRYAGLVLIDSNLILRDKWIVPDERVWPRPAELITAIDRL
jgi:peroxiredoxin